MKTKTKTLRLSAADRDNLLRDGQVTIYRRFQTSDRWRPHHYVNLTASENDPTPIGWGVCNRDGDEGYRCPWGTPGDDLLVRDVCGRFVLVFAHVDLRDGAWRWVGMIITKREA
jgi:hypothetical protein